MWHKGLLFYFITAYSLASHAQQLMVFSTVEGTLVANINEIIIRDAYQRIGINVLIKKLPAARALQQSNAGEFDGELFRIANIDKKYPNLIMIPEVSYEIDIRAYSKMKEFNVAGWESLKPFKLGIERGVQFSEIATQGMHRQVVNTSLQLFHILNKDRVEIAVSDVWSALGSLRELEKSGFIINEVRALSPRIMAIELHHYLHIKHKDLIPKVSQSIRESLQLGIARKAEDKIRRQFSLPNLDY